MTDETRPNTVIFNWYGALELKLNTKARKHAAPIISQKHAIFYLKVDNKVLRLNLNGL